MDAPLRPTLPSDRGILSAAARPAVSAATWRPAPPSALLFISGLAALVYQILWVKQLSLVVGVDILAVSTAVSAFFGGAALGNFVFGGRSDRHARPWQLYAWLEAGVGLFGIGTTLALACIAPLFAWLELHAGPAAWLLPFLLVGGPAFLMGGTLPVLVRALAPPDNQLAAAGGRLYAANTGGAIVGTLLTSFMLVPALGVRGSAFFAGALNFAAAIAAFIAAAGQSASPAPKPIAEKTERKEKITRAPKAILALSLYAVSGGLALGYEVIWSQVTVQWTSTRTFAFSIMLAVYLAGLTLGSAWAARPGRLRDSWGVFGSLVAAAGLSALLLLAFSGTWLSSLQVKAATVAFGITQREEIAMSARFLVAAGWMVLLPTFFLGAAFPAALRLSSGTSGPGRATGIVLGLNTLGGIAGTLLTGFILVPWLGSERSLGLMAVAAGMVGVLAVLKGADVTSLARRITFSCTALSLTAALLIPPDHLSRLLAGARGGELRFHEASPGGTVAVIEQSSGPNRFRRLYIQGVSNSGDSMTSQRYMRLQALLPLLIHRGEPRSALVIGLGTGITAGNLLHYPGLQKRVCSELLPAVVRAASLFSGNAGVTADPRVEIRLRDGRRELLRSTECYDLITLEPPPPSAASVTNLYSTDFYRLAAGRLNTDGLLAQWLPLPTQTDADTRSLVRSFLDVFPHATLWTTELHEMLLIGSPNPLELNLPRIASRFSHPAVSVALAEVGINRPAALLATWVTDRSGLERYAAGAQATTDDCPRIEYGEWVMPGEFVKPLLALNDLRVAPPVLNADSAFRADLERERDILLTFYEAGIHAARRDRERWRKALAYASRNDPENPYYRWFVPTMENSGAP